MACQAVLRPNGRGLRELVFNRHHRMARIGWSTQESLQHADWLCAELTAQLSHSEVTNTVDASHFEVLRLNSSDNRQVVFA